MKISRTLFFINRLSSTSENYFPDLGINLSRPGTYRPLVTEAPRSLKSPTILSDPKYVVMHANKKGRSSYRGASRWGCILSPFVLHAYCITIFISIPNRVTARSRRNNGKMEGVVRMGERKEPVELTSGRKLFSSNWHLGWATSRRRIIFSH